MSAAEENRAEDRMDRETAERIVADTRHWLETAVIGLDLCPFARPVHEQRRIRYAVSPAETPEALLEDLLAELQALAAADPDEVETTLLIHPGVLGDFLDFNDFLGVAEAAVADLGLEGVLQVASFHPRYQFEGTGPDDVENSTNRSPWPILHLLREESVERALATHPDPSRIYRKNIETLRRLGHEGWRRLGVGPGGGGGRP
jgi:uncharacterized protein